MTARQQHRRKQPKAGKRHKASLAESRMFAPLMGLWGALLGGLPVLVIAPDMFASVAGRFIVPNPALPLQPVLAGTAALVLGGAIYAIAAGRHRRTHRSAEEVPLAARALREVWPIDPARDLGSRSLDEPIETMPFASPAWRDADMGEPALLREHQFEPAPAPEPQADMAPSPRALDLSEFAELPGRNAVWVEETPEPVVQPAAEPVAYVPVPDWRQPAAEPAPASVPEPGTAALARLRSVPPSELSLPQMVERFAVALHQHRTSPAARALTAAEIAAREAALAEALRALAALSGTRADGVAGSAGDDPLRVALSQLQARRGAA